MKKIISILSLATLLFSVGCSNDWLDINSDPNNPSEALPELILPNGVFATGVVTGGYYNLLGGMYSQYWAQANGSSQYRNIDSYTLTDDDFEDQWETLYAVALTDLRSVRNQTEASGNWNLYLQATAMEVYTWQMLVDLYDKIPYFNALKGESGLYSAGYDDGDKIYDDLIIQLNKALSKDFDAPSAILSKKQKAQDFIFEGDKDKWIAFANTLKLKIYLRQSYARPSIAQTGINELFTNGATFLNEDAKIDIFIDEQDKDNPLYASNIRNLNTSTNLRSSSTFYKYLQSNLDTRISSYCGPAPDGTNPPFSMPQGGYELPSTSLNPVKVSVFVQKATTPVYFFTLAEVNFLLAEVSLRYGLGNSPKSHYDAGVLAAFSMYNLDGSSFIATSGAYEYPSADTEEKQLETIMMQKWISMAGIQGLESFLETNRTGYPKESTFAPDDVNFPGGELAYSLSGVTNGLFPRRLLIPKSEKAGNPNLPTGLEGVKITDNVWWDTK